MSRRTVPIGHTNVVVAVHAWRPPLGTAWIAESVGVVWSELDAVREALVAQRLAACADRHPGVRVERHAPCLVLLVRPTLEEQMSDERPSG